MHVSKIKVLTQGIALFSILIAMAITFLSAGQVSAQQKNQVVRLAKIQVDPAQLESYKAALKEGIETAVRIEPGVLTYYAVADKGNPTHITILEIYADSAAYRSHIETPHFKKYKRTVEHMIKSLELVDVDLIAIAKKP